MQSTIEQINRNFKDGIVPSCFNYSYLNNADQTLDYEKIKYNAFYRSYEFHESKFPPGYNSIPGFDQIIQSMADTSLSPLEEYNIRNSKN